MFSQINLSVSEIKDKMFFHGRHILNDQGLTVYYSAAGFGICFTGSCVSLGFKEFVLSEQPIYVTLIIDGVRHKFGLSDGRERAVVDGLEEGIHTLDFYRESTHSEDAVTVTDISVSGLNCEILPHNKNYGLKLQIMGDSITCGYGNTGKRPAYYSHEENATLTYGFLAGELLNADTRLIGWSGKGLVISCGGDRTYPLTRYYNKLIRSQDEICNDGWIPDVVVINIGTNDTGEVNDEEYATAGINFVKTLRRDYPNAVILFFYGMMGWRREAAYKKIMEEVSKFDKNVYLKFTGAIYNETRKDTEVGANGHPSIFAHKRCADELADEINRILTEKHKI